ncbi:glutamine amidotransferase family protein [Acuticoccus sp. I52.16.1]|uniref:class II glutamine amidotransferase n=1 Tax=Acuticoccus sp. I52.16.1 TaxID=2928472 RepID=UPI001FD54D21|nr:glutamine amidotransferase family protein [Acuticoccus sp. I52.16.1]UOM33886.1 glutamine amidotransferase family protein [Acuticoccus sp. I52.16.1]
MCGIVGLFLKNETHRRDLGALTAEMLAVLTDRGPDSAGIAIYSPTAAGRAKLTVRSEDPSVDWAAVAADVARTVGEPVEAVARDTHAVLTLPGAALEAAVAALRVARPDVAVMSRGEAMEIYKEVGLPPEVAKRFDIAGMGGTHAIGHTRMATESAVTTMGAHPFSTGADQCLIHNGSLSNHNNVRRTLRHAGIAFESENDTEVAAAYLTHKMAGGLDLGAALDAGIADLDGFYTFVVATRTGFGVLRDPIACKPAVLAETDDYVAIGSEYRAMAMLPGIDTAKVWEPEPATSYFWTHQ